MMVFMRKESYLSPLRMTRLILALVLVLGETRGGAAAAAAAGTDSFLPASPLTLLNSLLLEKHRSLGNESPLFRILNNEDGSRPFASNLTTTTTTSLRRVLQESAFAELNRLLQGARITLPDTEVSDRVAGIRFSMDIRGLYCTNINVGDIGISHAQENPQRVRLQLDIIRLDMNCFMNYRYRYGFLRGSGSADAYSNDNSATAVIAFTSPNFATTAPTSSAVEQCTVNVALSDLDFHGDFISRLLNTFERLIRGTVEREVGSTACSELSTLGSSFLGDYLDLANEYLNPYLLPPSPEVSNPLWPELQLPSGNPNLLDFQDDSGEDTIGKLFTQALDALDKAFGTFVSDSNSPTGWDLGVNVFLRDTVLDENGAFVLSMDDLDGFDNVLFRGHDQLSQTAITLNSVEVLGLDTFTKFKTLFKIGKYTLQNDLNWDYLKLVMNMTITMSTSTQPDSILTFPENAVPQAISETITVRFGVEQLEAMFSILLPIDEQVLGNLPLGALLVSDRLLTCFQSILWQAAEISGLLVSVGNIQDPILTGFISPGLDKLLSDSVRALFTMYENILLRAMPNIFQTTVRNILNEQLLRPLLTNDNAVNECAPLQSSTRRGKIDFRDLLLKPEIAVQFGGSGKEPYGDVAWRIMELVYEQFLAEEDDGLPSINQFMIRPLTQSQSGTPGMLRFPSDIFRWVRDDSTSVDGTSTTDLLREFGNGSENGKSIHQEGGAIGEGFTTRLLERAEIAFYDTRVHNLDTFSSAQGLLQPTSLPHELQSLLQMGPVSDGRRLNLTMTLLVSLQGAPLHMRNVLDISASVESALLSFVLGIGMDESPFMWFPLKSVLNYQCWLATISPPRQTLNSTLSSSGITTANLGDIFSGTAASQDADGFVGAALTSFLMSLSLLQLDSQCLSCSSQGITELPDLLDILHQQNATRTLQYRLENVVNNLLTRSDDWLSPWIDHYLRQAPQACPHRNSFGGPSDNTDVELEMPSLTLRAVDTLVFGTVLVGQIGWVILAESHLSRHPNHHISIGDNDTNVAGLIGPSQAFFDAAPPADAATKSNPSSNDSLVDWTDLEGSVGGTLGSLIQLVLDRARSYLGTIDEGKMDLGINLVLRDFLLQDNGTWDVLSNTTALAFEVPGYSIQFESLRVMGLDTFSQFDILQGLTPQMLLNEIQLETLRVEGVIRLEPTENNDEESEVITVSMGMDRIVAKVPLLASLDLQVLGSIELESLLSISNIVPCLLSSVHELQFPALNISIGSMAPWQVDGLLPDSQASVTATINTIWNQYRDDILRSMPIVFDTSFRELINGLLENYIRDSRCSRRTDGSDSSKRTDSNSILDAQFMDFRELFADNSAYGDAPSLAKRLLDYEMLAINKDSGMPRINEWLLAPLSKQQSGTPGMLAFDRILLDFSMTEKDNNSDTNNNIASFIDQIGLDRLELRVFDVIVEELDSLGLPAELVVPNTTNGLYIDNSGVFGAGLNPARVSVRGRFAMEGDEALNTYNDFMLTVSLRQAEFFAVVLARIRNEALLKFPLRDTLNVFCWLSIFAIPEMDLESRVRLPGQLSGVGLPFLKMIMESLQVEVTCTNCTSPGLRDLNDILQELDRTGATALLEDRLLDLSLEVAQGEFVQVYLDRLLATAPPYCPHHPEYNETIAADVKFHIGDPFPVVPIGLSRESLESLVFAAAFAIQVTTAAVAKAHAGYDSSLTYPLSAQEAFAPDNNTQFLAFDNLGETIGNWTSAAIDQINDYLGSSIQDTGGPNGETDLAINVLIRSMFLDADRVLRFSLSESLQLGTTTETILGVSIQEVRLFGLDTFTSIRALNILGPQTIQTQLAWKRLRMELVVVVNDNIDNDSSSPVKEFSGNRRHLQSQELTLSLELSNIQLSPSLFLAIDQEKLGSIELGSLMQLSAVFPCLVSTAVAASFTEIDVSIEKVQVLSVTGFRSSEVQDAVDKMASLIMEEYGTLIANSTTGLLDGTLRAIVNSWMSYHLNESNSANADACTNDVLQNSRAQMQHLDFRDLILSQEVARDFGASGTSPYGDLFRSLIEIIDNKLLEIEPDGRAAVNEFLIAPLTKAQSNTSGMIMFPGELFHQEQRVAVGGFDANIELKVSDARIQHLDTVGAPLAILQALRQRPFELNNSATFGVIAEKPLRMAVRFLISLRDDKDIELRNDMEISIDLERASLVLTALLKIAENPFVKFPIRDTLNLNCWLATILPTPILNSQGIRLAGTEPSAALVDLGLSLARLHLNVTCIECSSPGMDEFTQLLSSSKAIEDVTVVANRLLDYATNLLGGEFVQVQIDRLLAQAPRQCPHHAEYIASAAQLEYEPFDSQDQETSISFLIAIAITAISIVLCFAVVACLVRWVVRRRHARWLLTLPQSRLMRLKREQEQRQGKELAINERTNSLFQSRYEIPWFVRYSVPVLIIGNIGFFLSGHLSLGATVTIRGELADESFVVDNFFEFSMAQSTVDIWQAGGRELAMMILMFSGVWPYTKQLISLALWFLPPRMVSASRRGNIFMWLDILAKWSMVDIFVLVITVAGFRISIQSPDVAFLPEDFYSLDLLVVPLWGLYANMIAQILSQLISHFIIHYHRRVVGIATEDYNQEREAFVSSPAYHYSTCDVSDHLQDDDEDQRERLCNHAFARPHRGESDKLVIRRGVNSLLLVAAFSMMILVMLGCSLPSFSLEVLGIVGVLVESGQGFVSAMTKHSLFTIVGLLSEEANFLDTPGDKIGLGSLSALLILSVLLVPLVQTATLLFQWFYPIAKNKRNRIAVFIEILQAWQYAEVYLIAVIIASWQLGPVSDFMINSYCESLEDSFSAMVYYGLLSERDAQCFRVETRLESASYILAGGAVVLALLNTFIMRAAAQYLRDKENQQREHQATEAEKAMEDGDSSEDDDEYDQAEEHNFRKNIAPAPVLFSDTFRWMLCREEDGVRQFGSLSGSVSGAFPNGDFPTPEEPSLSTHIGNKNVAVATGQLIPLDTIDEEISSTPANAQNGNQNAVDRSNVLQRTTNVVPAAPFEDYNRSRDVNAEYDSNIRLNTASPFNRNSVGRADVVNNPPFYMVELDEYSDGDTP